MLPPRRDDVSDARLWRLYAARGKSLKEIGAATGLHISTVSKRLKRSYPTEYPRLAATRSAPHGPRGPQPGKTGVAEVWRLFARGLSVQQIELRTGLSRATVFRRLRLHPGYEAELVRRIADPRNVHEFRSAVSELERLKRGTSDG